MGTESLDTFILYTAVLFEVAGVAVIFLGATVTSVRYLYQLVKKNLDSYADYRSGLGRSILLGLEILVAGDIIRTVAVEPNYKSLGVLAIIVAIRTFLSFSLEVEIKGRWPWQRA